MTVPNLANTWQATIKGSTASWHAETVFHVTAPTLSDPEDVANDCAGAWTATGSIWSIQSSGFSYDDVTVQPYDGSSAPTSFDASHFAHAAGSSGSGPVPPQVCWVITKRSLLAGRANRGRLYVPAIESDFLEPGSARWNSTHSTAMQDAADAFRDAIEAGTVTTELVIYSRKNNTKATISALVSRTGYLGSQRRRAEQLE
jgi:hypothetical protein